MAPILAEDPVTFTGVLEARRETVHFLARLLHQRRCTIGTRSGTRALGPFNQAVLALRWFLNNTRIPCWASDVRPGREHNTTCAKKAQDLLPALEFYEAAHQIPTMSDLGYVSLSPALRHPYKKTKGAELTEQQITYNKVIRGVHGMAERANALLKETFAALQLVSPVPTASAQSQRPHSFYSTSNTAAPCLAATRSNGHLARKGSQ